MTKGKELKEIIKEINEEIGGLKTEEEKVKFFLKLKKKYDIDFCGEGDGYITFKDPSTCGGCVEGQQIMGAIFGEEYSNLPFVQYKGERVYNVDLGLAEIFAKEGKTGVMKELENRENRFKKAQSKKQEEDENKIKTQLFDKYGKDIEKIPGLIEKLIPLFKERRWGSERLLDLKVDLKNKAAAYLIEAHSWGEGIGAGGIQEDSEIIVLKDGKEDMIIKNYRDRYDPKSDDWGNYFKNIEIEEVKDNEVVVSAIPQRVGYSKQKFKFNLKKEKK